MKDGFCKHNRLLIYCDECYRKFQDDENKRWLSKQTEIKLAYENSKKAYNRYIAFCSNPKSLD